MELLLQTAEVHDQSGVYSPFQTLMLFCYVLLPWRCQFLDCQSQETSEAAEGGSQVVNVASFVMPSHR